MAYFNKVVYHDKVYLLSTHTLAQCVLDLVSADFAHAARREYHLHGIASTGNLLSDLVLLQIYGHHIRPSRKGCGAASSTGLCGCGLGLAVLMFIFQKSP